MSDAVSSSTPMNGSWAYTQPKNTSITQFPSNVHVSTAATFAHARRGYSTAATGTFVQQRYIMNKSANRNSYQDARRTLRHRVSVTGMK